MVFNKLPQLLPPWIQDRIDPDFSEELTLEVIERGSAVHCVPRHHGAPGRSQSDPVGTRGTNHRKTIGK